MIKQTFKFAIKSFRKSALMNYLNVIGLTFGLSIFFLTSLFIYQESTYEHDFTGHERIYQIGTSFYNRGLRAITSVNVPIMTSEMPEVEYTTVFTHSSNQEVHFEDETYTKQTVISADSLFFKVFDFDLIVGDQQTVLNEPNSVVISEQMALNIFGTTDLIGKALRIGKNRECIIKGVSKSPKYKTQLNFDLLVSQVRQTNLGKSFWGTIGSYVYVKTHANVTVDQINSQLDRLNEKYIYPLFVSDGSMAFSDWRSSEAYLGYFAESLRSLRYESETETGLMPKANLNQTNTLLIVGIAALLISVINFVNISTARASNRMKEVAIKRIMGSSRLLLVGQFMIEAFLTIGLASVLALAITELMVKIKPTLFGDFVEFSVLHSGQTMRAIVILVVGITLLSGLYPAIYLSSGKTITILRSGSSKYSFSVFNAALLRKFATVIQFVFSIGLIGAVITMFMQIDFLRTRDIGYHSDNVIVIPNSFSLKNEKAAFKNKLERISGIEQVSFISLVPSGLSKWDAPIELKDENGVPFFHYNISADQSLLEAMNLTLLQGQNFDSSPYQVIQRNYDGGTVGESKAIGSDSPIPILVNEAAVKVLLIDNDPIGKRLQHYVIIGVVKDFVYTDLHGKIEPLVIQQKREPGVIDPILIKVTDKAAVLDQVETLWAGMTGKPLDYYMLDDNYERLVEAEETSFNTVLAFSIFAVLVSCIGLFGLAAFTVDQRIKEFGIRKVLGASITDIVKLFSGDFMKLIFIAFVISMPLTIYFLEAWLNNFSARIDIGYQMVFFTGTLAITIALTTVLLQSLKAGRLNPVDTLRNE
tara:strand:+ start:7293 stop:9740 length:2448 start_codon:yes stop_codon:yes gene_type:complete